MLNRRLFKILKHTVGTTMLFDAYVNDMSMRNIHSAVYLMSQGNSENRLKFPYKWRYNNSGLYSEELSRDILQIYRCYDDIYVKKVVLLGEEWAIIEQFNQFYEKIEKINKHLWYFGSMLWIYNEVVSNIPNIENPRLYIIESFKELSVNRYKLSKKPTIEQNALSLIYDMLLAFDYINTI